jgi:Collagen triple helix repeat (20 copies)
MTIEQQLAEVVALEIAAVIEPLQRKLATLEYLPTALQQAQATIVDLQGRLAAAEARAPIPGPPGAPGPAGPAGPAGADGLNGKDGSDGIDGKDGAPGLNGKDGAPGLDGKDGAAGLQGKDGAPGLAGSAGRDGVDGKDGRDGESLPGPPGAAGMAGADGAPGRDGRDGLSIAGPVGPTGANGIDGKDGKDGLNGKDGADGLGFDDLSVHFDEHKGWFLAFQRGDRFKEFQLGVPFDAGVWQAGRTYTKGAGVTVKGAYYIAQADTRTRPEDGTLESAKAWRLSVKGGRDGKPGPPGRDGKDGGS